MAEPARRSNRGQRWVRVCALAGLMVGALTLVIERLPGPRAAADGPEPFLYSAPVVVASDRPVCSLRDGAADQTNIIGQDGASSVQSGATVYWAFNDTVVRGADGANYILPNNLAWGSDLDAANCTNLTHLSTNGWALPLLNREPVPGAVNGIEAGAFLSSMMAVQPGYVHFYYVSAEIDPVAGYRLRGIGIGKFDTATLTAARLLGGNFLWGPNDPESARVTDVVGMVDGGYVYIFLLVRVSDSQMGTLLGRIAVADLESDVYEYWDGSSWGVGLPDVSVPAVASAALLWQQPIGTNTPSVAYSAFLGKWLAVYTGGVASQVQARVADHITGPWQALGSARLVDCPKFFPSPKHGFICYLAQQHPEYSQDGGRTIYVTFGNQDSYQVYLHEVRLAAPLSEWTDAQGRAVYVAGGQAGPAGFTAQGVPFYASDIAAPNFSAIHRWNGNDGSTRYGPSSPGSAFLDAGTAFYAPTVFPAASATNALYAPVFRWTKPGLQRYSPLNLSGAGYTRNEIAFFAACPDSDGNGIDDCTGAFPPCPDYNGDRFITIADLGYVVSHYRQPKPGGGLFTIADVLDVVHMYRQTCPN